MNSIKYVSFSCTGIWGYFNECFVYPVDLHNLICIFLYFQIAADGIRVQPNFEIPLRDSWTEYSKFLISIIRHDKPNFLKGRRFNTLSSGKCSFLCFFFCWHLESIWSIIHSFVCINFVLNLFHFLTDIQFVTLFLELPSLFKVRTLPKSPLAAKSSKCWRPSLSEVKDAVCLHVTVSCSYFYFFTFLIGAIVVLCLKVKSSIFP